MNLGEHSYMGGGLLIRRWNSTEIASCGKFCSIANNLTLYMDGNHHHDTFSTFPFAEILGFDCPPSCYGKGAPVIGNDVWISDNVTIYSGSVIEDGVVIGGNSVVAGHIPAYAVVCGNPAKVVKYRCSEEQRKAMVELKWWDLPLEVIKTKLIPYIRDFDRVIAEIKFYNESIKIELEQRENDIENILKVDSCLV